MSNEPADTSVCPKIATGIRGLDEVLFGGLPAGQLTLIAGGPGTGKTVMGLELLYRRVHSGQCGLFFTFEERKASLLAHARNMAWNLEELEKSGRLRALQVIEPPLEELIIGNLSDAGAVRSVLRIDEPKVIPWKKTASD